MTQNCSCHGAADKHSQTVAAELERPRYSPGLILDDSDLTAAVAYTQQLNRLLFRNLFGCGVVCGLTVEADNECGLSVTVKAGLALDGCGDPVQLTRPVTIAIDLRDALEADGTTPKDFHVILCGREKSCAPRSLVCDADEYDGVVQHTRTRAMAEVSVSFDPKICACACQEKRNAEGQIVQGGTHTKCHYDHETRIDCAPDCGCGTACACGCCVILAEVRGELTAAGKPFWTAVHPGVRRFVRPRLLEDPHPLPTAQNTVDAITRTRTEQALPAAFDRLTQAIAEHPHNTIGKNQALELVRTTLQAEMLVETEADQAGGGQ